MSLSCSPGGLLNSSYSYQMLASQAKSAVEKLALHTCTFTPAVLRKSPAMLSRNLGSLFSTSPKGAKKKEAAKHDGARLACVRDAPDLDLERMKVHV